MLQQAIALIIIIFFFLRIYWQKRKNKISTNEFIFWFVFWLLAALSIIYIKKIDKFVSGLGFSGSGIDILLYASVVLLFYFVLKLRIKLEKIEKDITKIVREVSLKNKKLS
jgi:hypothetical protein